MSNSNTSSTDTVSLGTSTEDYLKTTRSVIDAIDLKLAALLLARKSASKEAGQVKELLGLPRVDISRELTIERKYLAILGDTPEARILARHIIEFSKES